MKTVLSPSMNLQQPLLPRSSSTSSKFKLGANAKLPYYYYDYYYSWRRLRNLPFRRHLHHPPSLIGPTGSPRIKSGSASNSFHPAVLTSHCSLHTTTTTLELLVNAPLLKPRFSLMGRPSFSDQYPVNVNNLVGHPAGRLLFRFSSPPVCAQHPPLRLQL